MYLEDGVVEKGLLHSRERGKEEALMSHPEKRKRRKGGTPSETRGKKSRKIFVLAQILHPISPLPYRREKKETFIGSRSGKGEKKKKRKKGRLSVLTRECRRQEVTRGIGQ